MSGSNGVGVPRLFRTIAGALGVREAELTDRSSPESVSAWDSLNHLNIVLAIESEFGVALTPDEVITMADVARIRDVLRAHGVEV